MQVLFSICSVLALISGIGELREADWNQAVIDLGFCLTFGCMVLFRRSGGLHWSVIAGFAVVSLALGYKVLA